jgi:hypothetical protein
MVSDLLDYFEPDERADQRVQPTLTLPSYPGELVERVLANESSHPLVEMAHTDGRGYPLITVMGFVLMDGRVTLGSRSNGVKLKRLRDDPRCSINYHNRLNRDKLACITLVGRARIDPDPVRVAAFNRLLTCKSLPDDSPEVGRRPEMIAAMDAADRVLIVLDQVDGVYIQAPPERGHKMGTPSRVIRWRPKAV